MPNRFADLDEFVLKVDKLKFLKDAEGAELAMELINEARVLMQRQRSRILADQHYLGGTSMRTIAKEQDVSPNAVSLWLRDRGPKHYWTIREEAGAFIAERVPPRQVRQLVDAGRRAIPATWGLGEVESLDHSEEGLWHLLASQA